MPIGVGLNQEMLQKLSYPNMGALMGGGAGGGGGGGMMQQMMGGGGGGGGGSMQSMIQQLMQGVGGASPFTMGGVDAYAQQGQGMPTFGNHGDVGDAGMLNPMMDQFREAPDYDPLAASERQEPQQQQPGMAGGFRMPGGSPGAQ
ncbi:nongradient byssal precursor [uncultured Mediterranean phage]|nr:nongradient byssal precursor [uncultured Mediterranean phage]